MDEWRHETENQRPERPLTERPLTERPLTERPMIERRLTAERRLTERRLTAETPLTERRLTHEYREHAHFIICYLLLALSGQVFTELSASETTRLTHITSVARI